MKDYAFYSREELLREVQLLAQKVSEGEAHEQLVENLSLHQEELRMQNEELRQTQGKLEQARRKYFDLYDVAPVGYLTLSRDCIITELNLTFADFLGLGRQKVINRSLLSFVAAEDHRRVSGLQRIIQADGAAPIEVRLNSRSRKNLWVQLIIRQVAQKTDDQCFRVAVVDVTEKKLAEKKIADSNDYLQEVIDNLPTITAIINEQGVVERINQAWIRFGRENGSLDSQHGLGTNYLYICQSAVGPDAAVATQVFTGIRELLAKKRRVFEKEYRCDSTVVKRWFMLRASCFELEDGLRVILSHVDITRQKNLEMKIRHERDRYGEILSALNTGLRLIEPDLTISWVNEETKKLFPGFDPIGKKCHQVFADASEPCQDCGSLIATQTKESHFSERYFPAQKRWFNISSIPIMNDFGQVTKVIEGITDVTDRKLNEIALQESEFRYRSLFESNSLPMLLLLPSCVRLEICKHLWFIRHGFGSTIVFIEINYFTLAKFVGYLNLYRP